MIFLCSIPIICYVKLVDSANFTCNYRFLRGNRSHLGKQGRFKVGIPIEYKGINWNR